MHADDQRASAADLGTPAVLRRAADLIARQGLARDEFFVQPAASAFSAAPLPPERCPLCTVTAICVACGLPPGYFAEGDDTPASLAQAELSPAALGPLSPALPLPFALQQRHEQVLKAWAYLMAAAGSWTCREQTGELDAYLRMGWPASGRPANLRQYKPYREYRDAVETAADVLRHAPTTKTSPPTICAALPTRP